MSRLNLNNVAISDNFRVISDKILYDSDINRGIRTHNRFGKFFADLFGTGTIKVYINGEKYYLNKGSCYKLLDKHHIDHEDCKKSDVVIKLQTLFDTVYNPSNSNDVIDIPIIDIPISDNTPEMMRLEALDEMMEWAKSNKVSLGRYAYADLVSVIKFFKFINAESGLEAIKNGPFYLTCYSFEESDLEVGSIPIHAEESWPLTERNLKNLLDQFIYSIGNLTQDQHKIEFANKLNGVCIESRTGAAFIYAAAIDSYQNLETFLSLMEKYRLEAHEALGDKKLTIRTLTNYIFEKHGGEMCISDQTNCPMGVLELYDINQYLQYAEVDMD